jgi:glycosyltransferase involved in cell wall biosynthesis
VPAYQEAAIIGDVVRELCAGRCQVLVVDDGSRDATGAEASQAGATVLTHAINRGQGAALQTGISYALARGARVIVTFDADGQHVADDVEALIAPIEAGVAEVTLGSRFLRDRALVPIRRRWLLGAGVVFTRLASGIRLTDTHNGMRALSRRAAEQIDIELDGMAHASEIIDKVVRRGLAFVEVPVRIRYTEYSLAKGQRSTSAVRVAWDYLMSKLLA